jgi:hypothetical protein
MFRKSIVLPLAAIVIFALGVLVGSDFRNGSEKSGPQLTATRSEGASQSAVQSALVSQASRRFLSEARKAGYDERETLAASVPADEIFAHIELILGEANPDGLDSSLERLLDRLIAWAFEADQRETMTAILGMKHIGNRDFLFNQVLANSSDWGLENFEQLFAKALREERPHELLKSLVSLKVDSAPMEAITLSKEYLRNEDGVFDFPPQLMKGAIDAGWQTAFEYFKDSWVVGDANGSWGWGGDLEESPESLK